MVPNPLYWRGLPKLKEVDYLIIPNRDTALVSMQSHALDMWNPVTGHYVPALSRMPEYQLLRKPSYTYDHIDFNVTRSAVRDPAVRQALRMAIDRPLLNHKIRYDVGYLQEEVAPPTSPYFDPAIKMVPFSIARSNALLDKAGWKLGANGIRSKNGVKLNLDWGTTTGAPDADEQIELIRSWWKQIGVAISVKHYPPPLFFAPYEDNGIVYRGNWDIVTFAWSVDQIGDMSAIYGCAQIPPKGQNSLHWCNPRANSAMRNLYNHYNQSDRNRDDAIVMTELVNDVPTIVTDFRESVWAVNKDLRNFQPNNISPFDNVMNVDI